MRTVADAIGKARRLGVAIPAFNVPYLPMIEPVVRAVVDQDSLSRPRGKSSNWRTRSASRSKQS